MSRKREARRIEIPAPCASSAGESPLDGGPSAGGCGQRIPRDQTEALEADQVLRFAAERRIPSAFWESELAVRGATIAYGVDPTKELRRTVDQLARVLKGAKPAELPVDQATNYELVVNREAAQALGITIPASILARAR
ncbi:MAG: ABC transporter substrate binding protein [Casimicrobiaceae bacterium]